MDISAIRQGLSITAVLAHYGLRTDKNQRLNCPFHNDKTPSMQVYEKTGTVYCFSSNCKTHGKAIDVIDFILYKESCTKHEAIEKAKTMINSGLILNNVKQGTAPKEEPPTDPSILQHLEKTFASSVWHSEPAKQYCKQRALNIEKLKGFIGFNSGQFHHSSRKDQSLIAQCVNIGMLQPLQRTNNQTGENVSYKVFAKHCLTFMLRDKTGNPVSLYGRSIHNNSESKHFYLKNRRGLYPNYPKPETTKLILTESIIDAASLIQIKETVQNACQTELVEVLALYGTNGLTDEHTEAVSQLQQLDEIIFMLDNDAAGKQTTAKHCKTLQTLLPNITYTTVELPNKDVNETLQLHEDETIFIKLLQERKSVSIDTPALQPKASDFFVSSEKEKTTENKPTKSNHLSLENINTLIAQSGIVGEEVTKTSYL